MSYSFDVDDDDDDDQRPITGSQHQQARRLPLAAAAAAGGFFFFNFLHHRHHHRFRSFVVKARERPVLYYVRCLLLLVQLLFKHLGVLLYTAAWD